MHPVPGAPPCAPTPIGRRRAESGGREPAAALSKEDEVSDTSVTKVDSRFSPTGEMGQVYLASGLHVAMRL